MPDPGPSLIARLARLRRARLTPTGAAATVALTQAALDGTIENARPFSRDGSAFFRVELVLEPGEVESFLAHLETSRGAHTLHER